MKKRAVYRRFGFSVLLIGISILLILQARTGLTDQRDLFENGQGTAEFIKQSENAVISVVATSESGLVQASGFFISGNGVAVSSYHVFENIRMSQVEIHLNAGEVLKIDKILARNSQEDYIIFQVVNQSRSLPHLALASREPNVGDQVFSIVASFNQENAISEGSVSGFRNNNIIIETTLEIADGSNGGPLLNSRGEVIGVCTSSQEEDGFYFAVNTDFLQLKRFIGL